MFNRFIYLFIFFVFCFLLQMNTPSFGLSLISPQKITAKPYGKLFVMVGRGLVT